MNTAADCIPVRSRRARAARIYTRRVWRSATSAMDDLVYRAEDLVSELLERVREKTRPTAPSPDADTSRPTQEEWATWAAKNLPKEDAEIFQSPAAR